MKHLSRFRRAILCVLALLPACSSQTSVEHNYPATRQDNVRETLHGTEVIDPYRWLEDQDSPETRAWLAAQNRYADSVFSTLPDRDAIRQRLSSLMTVDSIAAPF